MTQREALNTIHAALLSGEQFGTVHRFRDDHPDGPRPYFSPELYKIPLKPFFGWTHYGSSANKATKAELNWIIRQIFSTTPAEFLNRYTTRRAFTDAHPKEA